MDEESLKQFENVVLHIFNRWSALKLAVEHGMGGRNGQQTAIDLQKYVYDFCTKNIGVTAEDVQDILVEIMDQEFDTLCEDNSINEISAVLIKYFHMAKNKNFEELHKELSMLPPCEMWLNPNVKLKIIEPNSDSADSSSSDEDVEMNVEHSNAVDSLNTHNRTNCNVDPDGWTLVNHKKK